jgi:hypothetical protein
MARTAIAFFVFASTAVVVGLHNFYNLMAFVNGAPINIVNLVAFIGSVVLAGAALVAPFRFRFAAKLGATGSLFAWLYYLPLVFTAFLMPFTTRSEMRELISDQQFIPIIGLFLGPILLVSSTLISALGLRRPRQQRHP